MAGFADDASGQDVVYADNIDFSGGITPLGQVLQNGQLMIGAVTTPHIRIANLTSSDTSLTITNGPGTIDLIVAGATSVGKTITGDAGGALLPTAGNWNILGQKASTIPVMDTIGSGSTLNVEDRSWLTRFVVDPNGTVGLRGTFQTIASALAVATSGTTIFIRPGTYTENLTLVAGVNLSAFASDSSANATGIVIISGTCTLTTAGSVTISGIQLQTNSAALLAVTGSAASIVNLQNCYLNCTNSTGITFSSSNAAAQININYCLGNLGTTGIGYFTDSSTGTLNINYCEFANTGSSVTASTKSAGLLAARFSTLRFVLTYSSTSTLSSYVTCNATTNAINTTTITSSGTGTFTVDGGRVDAGSASAISAGSGTTVACRNCIVFSTNTNALTGAGTITSVGILFSGTSIQSNVTTQTGGAANGLTQGTAPSAGFLGEQISTKNTAGTGLSNGTAASLGTIALTPGIWDIGCFAVGEFSGAATLFQGGISTSSTVLTGNVGDNLSALTFAVTATFVSFAVPSYRVTISANTNYFLTVQANFSTGACTGVGRISATRVG